MSTPPITVENLAAHGLIVYEASDYAQARGLRGIRNHIVRLQHLDLVRRQLARDFFQALI